jgi:hypothetical protein
MCSTLRDGALQFDIFSCLLFSLFFLLFDTVSQTQGVRKFFILFFLNIYCVGDGYNFVGKIKGNKLLGVDRFFSINKSL